MVNSLHIFFVCVAHFFHSCYNKISLDFFYIYILLHTHSRSRTIKLVKFLPIEIKINEHRTKKKTEKKILIIINIDKMMNDKNLFFPNKLMETKCEMGKTKREKKNQNERLLNDVSSAILIINLMIHLGFVCTKLT